jgi:hypothetical protein
MSEPTVAMYRCHTWTMTDRITLSKFLGDEHFEDGVWAGDCVRGMENQTNQELGDIKPLIWQQIFEG